MKRKPKIKMIDYGIAFYFHEENVIGINRKLHADKELYDMVLAHELEHYNNRHKLWKNNLIDLKDNFNIKKQWKLSKFFLLNLESFYSLLPLIFRNKKTSVNWFMTAYWLFIIAIVYVLYNHITGG